MHLVVFNRIVGVGVKGKHQNDRCAAQNKGDE